MSAERPPTFWHAITPSMARPPLGGPQDADVAVIGAGFTGLSAAATLAEGGRTVIVLEAASVGYSASGRNAGFVVPNFSKADPAYVISKLGTARGKRLLALVASAGGRVFELARQAGLGEQAAQSGWLQPAHSPEMARIVQARVAAWQALGRPIEWLDPRETERRTGIDIYHGALRDASGGVINPLAHVQALAARAEAAGAAIFEQSPALSVEREGTDWLVRTPAGAVRARTVLLCTNSHDEGAAAMLGRTIIPLRVYQIATELIAADEIARFSPHREPVSDTRANIFTFRLTSDNRLISGGMARIPIGAEARMGRRIASRLAAELKLRTVPRVDFVWRGTAAVTTDFLPHLVSFGPGFVGATACNGRGVAMTTVMGEVLGEALLEQRPFDDLAVPLMRPSSVPARALARWAPSAFLLRGDIADRQAIRRTRDSRTDSPTMKPQKGTQQ